MRIRVTRARLTKMHHWVWDAGLSGSETSKPNGNDRREDSTSSRREDTPTSLNSTRIRVPMVTRSTLEVVIPDYAIARLLAKSKNKVAQIGELSGAKVKLVEDDPDSAEKYIRISGTPEQAERAQSLLQCFFLSIQEDGPLRLVKMITKNEGAR